MANDDQFLVMGAANADTLVEKNLAAGCVHLDAQMSVLLRAETEPVGVRPPEQPLDACAPTRGCSQDCSDFSIGIVAEKLVGVAPPVGEIELIAGAGLANRFQQAAEICSSVQERFDPVAGAPGQTVRAPSVKRCDIVAAFRAREKPAI